MSELDTFVNTLHKTSKLLVRGKAIVMGHEVDAVLVSNLYGQRVVWGLFSVDNRKGKFVGKLANNANTEGVVFKYPPTLTVEWPVSEGEKRLSDIWRTTLQSEGKTKH